MLSAEKISDQVMGFQSQDRFLLATESEEASRQSFCLVSDPMPALLLCSAPQGADACKLRLPAVLPTGSSSALSVGGHRERLEDWRAGGARLPAPSLSFLACAMGKPIVYSYRVFMRIK